MNGTTTDAGRRTTVDRTQTKDKGRKTNLWTDKGPTHDTWHATVCKDSCETPRALAFDLKLLLDLLPDVLGELFQVG